MKTRLHTVKHEGDTVEVTLHANSWSKFSSLKRTATRHFQDWQHDNFRNLGYKEVELFKVTHNSDPDFEFQFFYTVHFRLVY